MDKGFLSQEERDKLPSNAFGLPKRRLFPIVSQEDVWAAERLLSRIKILTPAEISTAKANITRIAKRNKFDIPEAWQGKSHNKFSNNGVSINSKVELYPDEDLAYGIVDDIVGSTALVSLYSADDTYLGFRVECDQSMLSVFSNSSHTTNS